MNVIQAKTSPAGSASNRLIGLDVLRIVAMIAVVLLHCDEGKSLEQLPALWPVLTDFATFAVPFFLAASFYLTIGKLLRNPDRGFPLKNRLLRLLLPYLSWTTIYVLYKLARYSLLGKQDTLQNFFSDPLAIIFLGQAGLHLYFLPLLMSGTLMIKLLPARLIANANYLPRLFLLLVSLFIYEMLLSTGNGFQHGPDIAFDTLFSPAVSQPPVLRVGFVYMAWAIRCLPYCLMATVVYPWLSRCHFEPVRWQCLVGGLFAFLAINLWGEFVFPPGVLELLRGYVTVVIAIWLSPYLRWSFTSVWSSLGSFTFGIYLIHLLFVEAVQSVWVRLSPVTEANPSMLMLLVVTGLIFLVSWLAILMLSSWRWSSKLLFAT